MGFQSCIQDCYNEKLYLECGCNIIGKLKQCTLSESILSVNTILYIKYFFNMAENCVERFASEIFSGKMCDCKQPCIEKTYKIIPTTSKVSKYFPFTEKSTYSFIWFLLFRKLDQRWSNTLTSFPTVQTIKQHIAQYPFQWICHCKLPFRFTILLGTPRISDLQGQILLLFIKFFFWIINQFNMLYRLKL